MALEKVIYEGDETTATAKNMNDIQDAVIALEEKMSIMALEKVVYEDHKTLITAKNMNDIQDAIISLEKEVDDFIGVKYSDFDNTIIPYNLPTVADARSLESMLSETVSKKWALYCCFYQQSPTVNNGYFGKLKTVYLPSGVTHLDSTFTNCYSLTTIIGDLTDVVFLRNTFDSCRSLIEIPYMPNLEIIQSVTFRNCTGLTSVTFYKVLTTWSSDAFQGCTNIETINLVDGWNTSIYAQHCPKLTQACLHDMAEKFADMTGKTATFFRVGEENILKMDDEHITMLENKNIDYS